MKIKKSLSKKVLVNIRDAIFKNDALVIYSQILQKQMNWM